MLKTSESCQSFNTAWVWKWEVSTSVHKESGTIDVGSSQDFSSRTLASENKEAMACPWFHVTGKVEYTCVALNTAHPSTRVFEAVMEDRVGWD